jgi:hypothetical protein
VKQTRRYRQDLWVRVAPGSSWWARDFDLREKWPTTIFHEDDPAWGVEDVGWAWE